MKSPFPGMDPFIEACGLWEGFHGLLVGKIADSLAGMVPERYLVRLGERSYIVLVEPEGIAKHPFIPDVSLAESRRRKKNHRNKNIGGTALAEPAHAVNPITMLAFVEEEHRETFVEIREAVPGQRLVTSIEVLSPTNKREGTPGWDLYLELNLQPLMESIYQHYRYERSIDYARPLSPALSGEEKAWTAKLLHPRKKDTRR